jgi:predicted kinase
MPRLIITRGLPASGKTTRARAWVAEDPVRRARVNRDDIRAMAHDSAFVKQDEETPGTERAIQAARDALVTALLKRGLDVVVDDTSLPTRTARDLRRLAVLAGAEFEVWDLTGVPYEECLRRNAAREGRARVPDERMLDMYQRFVKGKPYPLPLPDEPADAPGETAPYVPPTGAPKAVMVDVDGTVALMAGRSPYDETRIHEDRPNLPVIAAVRAMHAAGHEIVFCSGRTDACWEATEVWLKEHVAVPFAALFMRRAGDGRKDSVVKREIFDEEIRHRWNVVAVFDDRAQVVRAWREIGLTVFAVAEGNF